MMKRILISITLLFICVAFVQATENKPKKGEKLEKFILSNHKMYKKGYIDFNKNGKMDVYENPKADIDARVDDLLSQMNIEEKTCQMATLYGYKRVLPDDLPTPEWKSKIWKDGIGSIDEHLNSFRHWNLPVSDNENVWPASRHAWAINKVQQFFVEETRLGIPVDFTDEGIRGVESYRSTNFPSQIGMGHTWNPELVQKMGYITGREGRLLGYTNVYAPILDVGRDQRWGRYEEIYGEDPYLVAELGVAMVNGIQTNWQVIATGKHYAAYSNNKGAREGMSRVDPQMSPREVENIHMYPWREVIRRTKMKGVMSSYNDYDGIPIQGSRYWLTEVLRNQMGFDGYVVSDSDAVEYLHSKHRVSANMKESVRLSVEAGLNVRCTFRSPDSYIIPLRELVAEGVIPMDMINERVRDVLKVKFLVGLFDDPYQRDYKAADIEVDGEANNRYALQASREAIVLLKNNKTLPLDRSKLKKIALIGPNAKEEKFALLHYGPQANEVTNVFEGVTAAAPGVEILYAKGCDLVDSRWPISEILPEDPNAQEQAMIDEAVKVAEQSDVIVAVMGGGARTCGENKSRTSLELAGHQNTLLKALKKTNKPLVVVLINGRPLSINWADKHADAIVEAWYPGAHGGQAIAEVLFGDYNPGGKLTVTFPKTVGQIPFNFPYKPASQVDGPKTVGQTGDQTRINGALYNFGYGLSYTTFKYSNLKLSKTKAMPYEDIEVTFDITNTGKVAGDEVAQLYVTDRLSSLTVYEKQLRGFKRVHLKPNETKQVKMTLRGDLLSLLDENMKRVVEPGYFDIMIGASSTDIRLKEKLLVLDKDGQYKEQGAYSDDVSVVRSVLPATLTKGVDVTFPVKKGEKIDHLIIEWGDATEGCEFEILTTEGGGQFLPVYGGVAQKSSSQTCRFDATTASEIRVAVTKGKGTVKSLKSSALIPIK